MTTSDTPRTDAEYDRQRRDYDLSREFDWPAFPVDFDFARDLERQLATAQRELEEARRDSRRLESAIRWALGETDFRARKQGEGAYWWRKELRARAAMEARE